jgi:tetratricopeptide (TPR) repeat protein
VRKPSQRPPLPARLTAAERDFCTQLRRLVDAAGLSCRALEESTSSSRSGSEPALFYSKSQWGRWLNGESIPPRKAVRRLTEVLAAEQIDASRLADLWARAFAPGDIGGAWTGQTYPRQLPIRAQRFVGRTSELATLTGLAEHFTASNDPVVIILEGTAGVGKTTLAIELAHSVCGQFPDGQLHVDLRGFDPAGRPMAVSEALHSFLEALGVAPKAVPVGLDDRAALYRTVLAGKRLLIVIDNARDADQVRPLLPGSSGSLVLVTSRNQLSALGAEAARPLHVEPFTPDEARELLASRLGAGRIGREPQAADELSALCARLPLALSVAAAHAQMRAGFPLGALASELRSRGLDLLETGDPATTMRTVFFQSYQHLSDDTARVFRLLGLLPGPDISVLAAASLASLPVEKVYRALDELVRAHLAEEHLPGRFRFHDLLRAYAAEQAHQLDAPADRHAAVHRVLDHYLHMAVAAAVRFNPFRTALQLAPLQPGVVLGAVPDTEQALAWLEAEAPVLLPLTAYAETNGFHEYAWQIPWALAPYFHRRGRWADYVTTQQTALAAAQRLADSRALAHANYQLGHAHAYRGEYDLANLHMHRALELFRDLGDRASEAVVLNGLSLTLERQGRYAEALPGVLEALRILKAVGHWWAQATLENSAGWLCAHLGQYPDALSHSHSALSLHRESGNLSGAADTMDTIGYIQLQLKDLAEAKTYVDQALKAYRELGDPFGEANALNTLGDVLAAQGDALAARAAWLGSEAILNQLSHPHAEIVRIKLQTSGVA